MTKALEILKNFISEDEEVTEPWETNHKFNGGETDIDKLVNKLHSEHHLTDMHDPVSKKFAVHFNGEKIGEVHSYITQTYKKMKNSRLYSLSGVKKRWTYHPSEESFQASNNPAKNHFGSSLRRGEMGLPSRKEALDGLFKSHASLHFKIRRRLR